MLDKPDIAHLKWAIDQRAKIQHTLLSLYEFLRNTMPHIENTMDDLFVDHLIAAAFSLWRAVFLAERERDGASLREAQEKFLATVISTNAITFSDDRSNSAWSVGFYLENAKQRILSAQHLAFHHPDQFSNGRENLDAVIRLVRIRGWEVSHLRYEWECAHTALRMLLRMEHPAFQLPIENPALPTE
jgi:hypothetical protein